ncbi:gamma carbonic anhydrase family protein [Hyphomicrobium sp. CS1BSMeth3]|uniref:gamma carbonic anhydrase family protein n=1 Tax=Hyphomicrobium sp. CS1BSMeth3 TaxID=1892844 RepID=UPI000930BACF|nr:gamma carbonic anhydrase family protein [Hyphomicrobium sp. CS1BSMeth3]
MTSVLKQRFPEAAWIDASASVYGDVTIGEGASLWPGVSIRAELLSVTVGRFVNLQDHVMVHIGYSTPTVIGDYASITHRVVLHGCTIGENCLIGIGATIMDGAVIGANSIVAGHAFVREGQVIPPNSIVMGTPAKVVRTADNFVANRMNAWLYHRNAEAYALGDHRAWTGAEFEKARDAEKARLEALHAAGRAG